MDEVLFGLEILDPGHGLDATDERSARRCAHGHDAA
jgi:hypothetical protein